MDDDVVKEMVRGLTLAIRSIAHGEMEPTGIEALTMALIGPGAKRWNQDNILEGFNRIASAIESAGEMIAEAIRDRGSS